MKDEMGKDAKKFAFAEKLSIIFAFSSRAMDTCNGNNQNTCLRSISFTVTQTLNWATNLYQAQTKILELKPIIQSQDKKHLGIWAEHALKMENYFRQNEKILQNNKKLRNW